MNQTPENRAPKGRRLRILLADCSPTSCQRWRRGLGQFPFLEIVGVAHRSDEALGLLPQLQPDAVVTSIILIPQDGLEILHCIKRTAPECAVILTSHAPNSYLEQAAELLGATWLCATDGPFDQVGAMFRDLWERRIGPHG